MSASEHSSSQSSSKGSRAGRRRTNLTTAALFPVLKAVTTPYPWQLSALGFFIELLQPFSLALNPHTAGHITTWSILYFVQLPCWDGTYAKGLTYSQFLGFYWALSIICWIIIAAAVVSVEYTHYMATVVVKYFLKHIINLMTTVMVVPIAQLLMTTLVCQKPYGSSVSVAWLFTEQRCDETVHLVHYGISIALMIVWFVVAAVVTSCNFVADPEATGNFRRQAHPYVDLALLVYRVGICVSFHLFLSMNMASYYSFLVAVLSFSMSILYMVVLPYHERFVNQLSTVVYALVGWSATTVFIFDKIGGAYAIPFVQMGGFYATLTLGALAVGTAAYFLSAIRYSSQTDRLLKMCTVAGFVPLEENPFAVAAQQKNPELQPFPRNLPTSDFIFSPHRFVETDVIEEALRNDELLNELEDAPGQGGGDDVESKAINRMAGYIRRVQVVSPTVDVARFPTDAELSVRFLADWTMRTRAPPTPHMLGFACRVFAKFLLLFPDSPTAAIAYVRFLTVYAPSLSRMNLSVKLLDSIPNEMMCDLHHLYQVYLLTLSVKEVLGVRDKNHEKMYRRSRRLHKETLIQTASVWRSLLEDDRSLVSLCFLTNTLSDVRQKCADTYLQALNAATDDEILFRSFSNFADQVTQNKPCAALCITEAERVSKRRRARLLQRDEESTSGGESTARSGVSRAQKEEESQTVLRHIAESIDQQSETLSQNLSSTFVYTAAVVTFIILCGVVVADAAIVLSWLSKWPAETERSYHMGNVRTNAQNMLVRLYSVRGELPDDGTLSDTTAFRSEMAQLAAVGYAFEAAFNFLTYGEGKSTDAQMTAYIKEPSSIVKIFTTSTESILLTRDFWSMGSMLSERFATTLTYLQTIPTKAQFDSHPDVMFLVENIPNTYDIMFGRAVVEMREAHVRYARSSSTVYGASLAVVVALLVVGAYIFLWNFRRSASTKVESLNLFHLIPSDSVKRLANDAKERVEKFVSGENMEKNTNDVANELSVGEAENNDTLSNEDTRRQSYSSKLLAHLFQSGGVETVESEGAGNAGATGGGTDAQFTSGTGPSKIVPLLGSDMDKDEPHHDRSLTASVSDKSSSDVFANDAKGASQSVSTRKRLSIVIGKGIDMGKVKRSSSILEMADPSVASEESPMERAEMEVHEAAVEEVDLDANSISRKSGITLPILLIVVALTVLFCVGIAQCASLLQSYSDTNKSLEKIDSERLCADRIRLDSLQMLLYIQRYVISADYEDYQRFAASYLAFVASKEACLGSLPSLRNIDYAQYIDTLAMVQELSAISAALVSSNLADAVATTFHGIQWTAPSRYSETVDNIGANWFPYTNTSYDQARPYSERVDLAVEIIFGRLGVAVIHAFIDTQRQLLDSVGNRLVTACSDFHSTVETQATVSVVMWGLIALTALLFYALWGGATRPKHASVVVIIVALVCLALGIAVISASASRRDKYTQFVYMKEESSKLERNLVLLFQSGYAYIMADNQQLALQTFLRESDPTALSKQQAAVVLQLPFALTQSVLDRILRYVDKRSSVLRMMLVAMRLRSSTTPDFASNARLSAVTWNAAAETRNEYLTNLFPDDSAKMYTSTANDMALNATQRILLAKSVASTQRLSLFTNEALDEILTVVDELVESQLQGARDDDSTFERMSTAFVAVAAICCFAFLLLLIALGITLIRSFSQTRIEESLYESLYSRYSNQVSIGLTLVAAGLILVAVLAITLSNRIAVSEEVMLVSTRRQTLIYQSMVFAFRAYNAESLNARILAQHALRDTVGKFSGELQTSYFESESSFTLRENQNAKLFGPTSLFDVRDVRSTLAAASASVSLASSCYNPSNTEDGNEQTATILLFRFIDLMRQVAYLDQLDLLDTATAATVLSPIIAQATAQYDTVAEAIHESNKLLKSAVSAQYNTYFIVLVVVLVASFFIVLGLLFMSVIPVIQQLSLHEAGTKLLLSLLPEDIKNQVPEIANYYDANAGTKDDQLKKKLQQSEKLLQNILPPVISRRLKNGERVIADTHPNVTVVFAALIGFDEYSKAMEAKQIVHFLNSLMVTFDQITDLLELEKIKTIGDIYFLCGGLTKKTESDHPLRCMECALLFLEAVGEQNARHNTPNLTLRIGINTDPAVAGVIGSKKVAYDLWGDSVNTASRMQSTGIPGKIQVSDKTFHQIKEYFAFTERRVAAKGKGELTTHIFANRVKPTPYRNLNWRVAR